MFAMRGMMGSGQTTSPITDFFNGFELDSTFTGGPTWVKDYLDTLVKVPFGTRAIEGGELIYDFADGAYLGPEKSPNGTFLDTTGISTSNASISVSGGELTVTDAGASANASESMTMNLAGTYQYTCDLFAPSSNSSVNACGIAIGPTGSLPVTAEDVWQTKSGTFVAVNTATSAIMSVLSGANGDVAKFRNLSVKEIIPVWLPHDTPSYMIPLSDGSYKAKYPSTFKGYLNAPSRANLCLQSSDISQSVWSKTAISVTTGQTGINGNTACLLTDSDTISYGFFNQPITVTNSTLYTFSRFFKKTTGSQPSYPLHYCSHIAGGRAALTVDTSNGVVTPWTDQGITPTSYGIASYGNFWRVWVSYITTNTTAYMGCIVAGTSNPTQSSGSFGTGSLQGNCTVDGAQLELGAFPTSYIPTTTAAVTRPASVLSRPWPTGLVNNFGVWGRVVPSASGQAAYLFSIYSDGNNYLSIRTPVSTTFNLRKVISGSAFNATNIAFTHSTTPFEFMLSQSSSGGCEVRVKADGGSWSSWSSLTDANGKANITAPATYHIATLGGTTTAQFAGNYPFVAIIEDLDPKARLEELAVTYAT